MPEFTYSIPVLGGGTKPLTLSTGSSAVFVGANGSGKSRLGSHLELNSGHDAITHRVGAQRALQVPESVRMSDPDRAQHVLLYGDATATNKRNRWQKKPATLLLNDFGHLLVTLFSQDYEQTTRHKETHRSSPDTPYPTTQLDIVKAIWDDTISTRRLKAKGASLWVTNPEDDTEYLGDEMSDGERVLFYLIGQCLEAPPNGVIIIDEPELHIHKAVLLKVWDRIEAARPDCLFIYLTHDIDFAVSRTAGQKFAVQSYDGESWQIVDIPESNGLPEEITAKILGSRKPILFIEGDWKSKDVGIFSGVYDGFTVLPVGSCEHVIHLTTSYNAVRGLHHLACHGIIDRDGRAAQEVEYLKERSVHAITFAELENLLLAEPVMREVATLMGFEGTDQERRVEEAKEMVFNLAEKNQERKCVEFVKRRLEQSLSRISLEEKAVSELIHEFHEKIALLQPKILYEERRQNFEQAIKERDYDSVLEIYDDKGMVRQVGAKFDIKTNGYPDYVVRQIRQGRGEKLLKALTDLVPVLG